MSAREIVNKMSKPLRDSLTAHANGPQPIVVGPESSSRSALISRGLVRYDLPGNVPTRRPHRTALTDLGREVLCVMLGDYADALVRVGCLEEPLKITLKKAPAMVPQPPVDAERDLARDWSHELKVR